MNKKGFTYIIFALFLVIIIYVVITNSYINLNNHFSGELKRVTIYSSNEQSIIHIINEEDEMKQFESVFFNKITSNLGPSTSEAGNYTVTFEFENENLEFYILHTNDFSERTVIRFIGHGRDYKLSESDEKFLLKYIQFENATE